MTLQKRRELPRCLHETLFCFHPQPQKLIGHSASVVPDLGTLIPYLKTYHQLRSFATPIRTQPRLHRSSSGWIVTDTPICGATITWSGDRLGANTLSFGAVRSFSACPVNFWCVANDASRPQRLPLPSPDTGAIRDRAFFPATAWPALLDRGDTASIEPIPSRIGSMSCPGSTLTRLP